MTREENRRKHEEQLQDELFDVENKIIEKVENLINAEWDSPTVKGQIELLLKNRHDVVDELDKAGYFDEEVKK